jgi:four helix bundle protein
MVESFKELRIWQEGIVLAKQVYALVDALPDKEKFGLRSQITRAAVSVSSNIAEGSRRRSSNDLYHFLSIALGSLAELETQLIIAIEIGYLKKDACSEEFTRIDAISRGIVKLQQTLKKT